MHSSRMRTVRSSSRLRGGVCLSACWDTHSPQALAWKSPSQTPNPPGYGPGNPPCGQTDTCKNITFANFVLGGVCFPGGLLLGGVCFLGGVCSWGVGVCHQGGYLLPGRVCLLQGGCLLLGGVCFWGCVCFTGGGIPAYTWQTPPSVNRITHACENITLPQLRCGR